MERRHVVLVGGEAVVEPVAGAVQVQLVLVGAQDGPLRQRTNIELVAGAGVRACGASRREVRPGKSHGGHATRTRTRTREFPTVGAFRGE